MCSSPAHGPAAAVPSSAPNAAGGRWRAFSRLAGWSAALLLFLALFLPLWQQAFPPLPGRITLEVTFARGLPGVAEPLLTTGEPDDGDFLAVRYVDAENAVLFYDVWGVGGPASRPFALRPGERRTLEVELPTLGHVPTVKSQEKRPLRALLDGVALLDEPVHFHRRAPAAIFFAANPIGGTLVQERFRGELAWPAGRVVRGGPEALFSRGQRLGWLARTQPLALLGRAAVSVATGALLAWLLAWAGRRWQARTPRPARTPVFPAPAYPHAPHRWFVATAAVCTLAFTAVLTHGTFRLLVPDAFANLYDYQAASLLAGRLDLPAEARTSESFVFEGRHYLYFGPTPALLRLPLVAGRIAFGELSRCFLIGYYVLLLVAAYALLVHVARRAGGPDRWPARGTVVLFIATTGLSTTLFFLASRTYVYHEAILCGAMFAVWSGYFSLRYLAAPERAWWVGALGCGLLAIHARPTTGLFALCLSGSAAIAVALRGRSGAVPAGAAEPSLFVRLRRPALVGVLSTVGILSFNAVSYLKFRSFEGAPLRYHVQYDEARIKRIEGRNFHLSNFRYNFDAYAWRPDLLLRPTFPYLYSHRRGELAVYEAAKMDLEEPTLALPYTTPALLLLALAGGAGAWLAWPAARVPLGAIAAAATPMSLALFTAVAISQRYTADFCPALILAGAFGLQAIDLLRPSWRRAALTTLALLTVAGALVTLALTLQYQGELVWGVPDDMKARYQSLRKAVDGFLGFPRS